MLRVRFAPSPTGHLHIGGARTALFNLLFARQNKGQFIVRIEDTDLERSTLESEQVIIRDLKWLGIHWDEGIDRGGEYGPYRSTERVKLYKKYIDRLLEEGKAYYCYCTSEELESERKKLLEEGKMPRYLGKCRNLSEEEKRKLEAEGRKPTIRFKVPQDETVVVEDMVRGRVEFDSNGIGDFIIVKSDGIPVYNFAVVIDDHLMKITHVIRGEEHLSNTPRQVLIYNALDFPLPKFAHVSLILGKDRTKMSKRHGSTWVEQYRDEGYLPEAIVNFLALLGWSPEGEREIFSMEELIQQFSFDRVAKNPAVFDRDKLNWMNAHYIKSSSVERITRLAVPYLVKAGLLKEEEVESKTDWVRKIVEILQENLTVVSDIVEKSRIFFDNKIQPGDEQAEEILKGEQVPTLLDELEKQVKEAETIDDEFAKKVFKLIQKATGIRGKNLFMPIRVTLTGQVHGPEMVSIISILGKQKILNRIKYVRKHFLPA